MFSCQTLGCRPGSDSRTFVFTVLQEYLTPAHQQSGQVTLPPALALYHGPTELKKQPVAGAAVSGGAGRVGARGHGRGAEGAAQCHSPQLTRQSGPLPYTPLVDAQGLFPHLQVAPTPKVPLVLSPSAHCPSQLRAPTSDSEGSQPTSCGFFPRVPHRELFAEPTLPSTQHRTPHTLHSLCPPSYPLSPGWTPGGAPGLLVAQTLTEK